MTTRRTILSAAVAASALRGQAQAKPWIYELRWIRLRNGADNQRARLMEYLRDGFVPACGRAGIAPVGVFNSSIGPDTPFVLLVTQHKSLAAMEENIAKVQADAEYTKAVAKLYAAPGSPYVRMETSLLRAFSTAPVIDSLDADSKRPARLFEVRMYESNNGATLKRKISMFDSGEIGIFRRLGMRPVLFGETIAGGHMPNLVYMLAFDDLAHRERAWKAFGADDEWRKMAQAPGNTDPEIVSNISNWIVTPTAFSPLR